MKIIHIANFYGPKSGGIKTTLQNLGREYLMMGHEFIAIVPGKIEKIESTPHGKLIYVKSLVIPFSGGYRVIRSNRNLKKMLCALSPDKLEISDRFTLSGIGIWARKHGVPAIVFSHETLQGLIKNYFKINLTSIADWHNTRLASRFDHVVTTTDFAASEFKRIKSSNLVKIPLGVDLDIFHPAHRSEEVRNKLLKGGEVLIIHCGRLSPEKKPQRSIDALRHLLERGINARLVFIGHGPLYSKLYKSTRDIPVTFWGYVANRKLLATMLASADLTIAPGPLETFCLAALESLASGTPVVASNTSAVGEFLFSNTPHTVGAIAENNGLSFAEEIEKLILRMKTDPEIRSRCHQVALKYPWAKTANLLNQLPINPELKVA